MGLAVGAQFINLTIISFTFEFMINSPLNVYGSIWYFAGLTFLGMLFMIFFVRETKGLTDLEKKTLYSPKNVHIAELAEVPTKPQAASDEAPAQ